MRLIIASTGDKFFTYVNIDGLEPLKIGVIVNFSSRFRAVTRISRVNCTEMA